MNTCKDCKWWGGQDRIDSYRPQFILLRLFGECLCPKVNGEDDRLFSNPDGTSRFYSVCVLTSDSPEPPHGNNVTERETKHSIPLDCAMPYASDDYGLGFSTGPDFGCVHWEKKE